MRSIHMRSGEASPQSEHVRIPSGSLSLDGDLTVPPGATGVVLFAHGSGSSRHSPRNQAVASWLAARALGTLLMDLLTASEETVDEHTRHLRFDIPLLAERLIAAIDWLGAEPATRDLKIGLFGASTGAAAALVAAARRPRAVAAVVSRGGRPDLAGADLAEVVCPALLVVGSFDEPVIALNQQAMARMRARTELVIVPGASHLFEEPGTLEDVGRLAGDWFAAHLAPPS